MTSTNTLQSIQRRIWAGEVPLEVVLSPSESRTYDKTDPYLVSVSRLSYLPLLTRRLHDFFRPNFISTTTSFDNGWFSYEGVPLKWHIPVGLLFDLYALSSESTSAHPSSVTPASRQLPWRLVVHFENYPADQLVKLDKDERVLHDAFVNSVKEADFVRNGTGRGIMGLSKEDSEDLWKGVRENDLPTYTRVSNLLLPSATHHFRNIPFRVYLPSTAPPPSDDNDQRTTSRSPSRSPNPVPSFPSPATDPEPSYPSLKILQSPIPPTLPSSSSSTQRTRLQTLGTALHTLLPSLFPSRSRTVHAVPVLHGALVPMGATLEDLCRWGAYGDGWIAVVVRVLG